MESIYAGSIAQVERVKWEALKTNSIDMAVVLTEGIVKAISEGLSSKIVQTFVQSPLVWGVHVAYNSKFKTSSELKKKNKRQLAEKVLDRT